MQGPCITDAPAPDDAGSASRCRLGGARRTGCTPGRRHPATASAVRPGGDTGRAAPGDREVAEVDGELAPALDRGHQSRGLVRVDLPGRAAADAVQVAVDGGGLDVEL